jgi:hypothetical protein
MNDRALTPTGLNQPRYWLGWVAATIGGWIIGYLINTVIISAFNLNADSVAQGDRPELILASILAPGAMGLSVGVAQWLMLRRVPATQSPSVALWIPATTLGFALGTWFGLAFMGLGTGAAQWWVIRKTFSKSSWWPTISTVSWPLGYVVGDRVGGALLSVVGSQLLAGLIGILVTGLIIGAVTGAVLLWMLRERRLEEATGAP